MDHLESLPLQHVTGACSLKTVAAADSRILCQTSSETLPESSPTRN